MVVERVKNWFFNGFKEKHVMQNILYTHTHTHTHTHTQ